MGLIISRADIAAADGRVVGDPCIVFDDRLGLWRMVLFASPPGHGHAVSRSAEAVGPGDWKYLGPLPFANPQDCPQGTTHKPYIVQDAYHPNQAARINGRYCLVSVAHTADWSHKYIHQAWADGLGGPWTWGKEPLIPVGSGADFDAKHTDAVSGFYFPERQEIVYYYMGYPDQPQKRPLSPWGNSQGVAVQKVGQPHARKLGEYLPPCPTPGHWASGYLGGIQIFPGKTHKWQAMLNASPTAPNPVINEKWKQEPAPSLGGFAWCDEDFPVRNWHYYPQPLERIEDLPSEAVAAGENTNLWRHHILFLPAQRRAVIFYNSGFYGQEQLYAKTAPID
jgi:hypothetical protein